MTRRTGGLLVVASMLLWSTGPVLLRESALPAMTFMAIGNLAGAAGILAPGPRRVLRGLRAAPRAPVLVLALAGALNAITYYLGLAVAPIVDVMAAHYTGPVLVALSAPLLIGERPGARLWAGLGLSAAGLALILSAAAPAGGTGGSDPRLGVLLGLLSATGYAASVLAIRLLAVRGVPARVVSFVMSVSLLPFVLPFFRAADVTGPGLALAGVAGILHLTLAARLFARGAHALSAPTVGILGYSELVFGAAWGILVYGEPLPPARLAGALLVAAGGAVALTAERETARPDLVPPAGEA